MEKNKLKYNNYAYVIRIGSPLHANQQKTIDALFFQKWEISLQETSKLQLNSKIKMIAISAKCCKKR